MNKWILNLNIVKDAITQARLEGGIEAFPLAQKDILETMRDDLDKQAEELAKKKLNDLLSPVNMDAIVKLDAQKGILFIGNERADDARLSNLKNEAHFLLESDLWKLLYETPKELAQKSMFEKGENIDDLRKGRSILYTLSTQKKILDIFDSYMPKK